MTRYEILILAVPEITADDAKTIESKLDRLIRSEKGLIISFERWGKYRLAYPVKGNEYGVYFLMRFEVENGETLINEIKSVFALKLADLVLRAMIHKLERHQSLEYHRPPSLEETPARDVGSFLKEHKMEGLLSSIDKPSKAPKKAEVREDEEIKTVQQDEKGTEEAFEENAEEIEVSS
jgi:small subunit ribosomal protein S6